MGDIIRDLWRSASRDRMRVLLTLSGIVLGAAAIVFLASALAGASIVLTRTSQGETGDDLSHIHAKPPQVQSAAQTYRELSKHDRDVMAKSGEATAGNWTEHIEASHHGKTMWVSVQSGDAKWAELGGFHVQHGRHITEADANERVAVIGYQLWQEFFDGKWPIEDPRFQLYNALTLKVIGVAKQRPPIEGGGGDGSWMIDRRVWVSNTTYARGMKAGVPFEEILIRHPMVDDAVPDLRVIARRLTPVLQTLHLGVKNFEFDALNQGEQLWELLIWAMGAILFGCGLVSMFVGAVNVMNSQLMAFGERTKEFGLRRALGESTRQLQTRVAIEASIMAGVGGSCGVCAGIFGGWALSALLGLADIDWPFRIIPWSVLAALVLSSVVGLVAGLFPAMRASQLMPSEALRAD